MRKFLAYPILHHRIRESRKAHLMKAVPVPRDSHLRHGDEYLVQAHAAIEFYIEELCRQAVHLSVHESVAYGTRSKLLDSLLECHRWHAAASFPREGSPHRQGLSQIEAAVKWFVKNVIDKNNGIKKNNFLSLFAPLGFLEEDFDDLFLYEMDSLGVDRGDVAHGKLLNSNPPLPISLGNGRSLEVWTPRLTQGRAAIVPWELDRKIQGVLPNLLEWDIRVAKRSRS